VSDRKSSFLPAAKAQKYLGFAAAVFFALTLVISFSGYEIHRF
jgi:hypothetical protein